MSTFPPPPTADPTPEYLRRSEGSHDERVQLAVESLALQDELLSKNPKIGRLVGTAGRRVLFLTRRTKSLAEPVEIDGQSVPTEFINVFLITPGGPRVIRFRDSLNRDNVFVPGLERNPYKSLGGMDSKLDNISEAKISTRFQNRYDDFSGFRYGNGYTEEIVLSPLSEPGYREGNVWSTRNSRYASLEVPTEDEFNGALGSQEPFQHGPFDPSTSLAMVRSVRSQL